MMLQADQGMDPGIIDDLAKSGIAPKDINALELTNAERAATSLPKGTSGYVIPYYDEWGRRRPFYRIKVLGIPGNLEAPKYKQPRGAPNHLYFPPKFREVIQQGPRRGVILLTEGEKKAVKATKEGFAAVAVAGVDSWRNRTILLPRDTDIKAQYGQAPFLRARLPGGSKVQAAEDWSLAIGLAEVVQIALEQDLPIVIVFDTDTEHGLKFEVRRAAALLSYQLRSMGLSTAQLRLLELPALKGLSKVGLDDFLVQESPKALEKLIEACETLPRHPNPRDFVTRRLNAGKLSRAESHQIGIAILSELDATGRRLVDANTQAPFYFDERQLKLMSVDLMQRHGSPLHETPFGKFLYRQFGLTASDAGVLTKLAAQMTGEDPIEEVVPQRVLTRSPNPNKEGLAIQISDSQFVHITAEGIELCSNGKYGIMFEAGQVKNLTSQEGREIVAKAKAEAESEGPIKPQWLDVLKTVHFKDPNDSYLATILFYMSPWFWRWKGMQLPVEVYTGEPGSGKSSLVSLRLRILTGVPSLKNAPNDLRDWYASIVNSGGLHVTDNVHFTDKNLRQRLSDEICRIITEPEPTVEVRQLYTTSQTARIPVSVSFALTAITAPFTNPDFQQRAVQFDLAKRDAFASPDSEWVPRHLDKGGGRTGWLAHHIAFIYRFIKSSSDPEVWSSYANRPVTNRLIHYEAGMHLAADILGIPNEVKQQLGVQLRNHGEGRIVDSDRWLRAVKRFIQELQLKPGTVVQSNLLLEWFLVQDTDAGLPTTEDQLERFIASRRSLLAKDLGLIEIEKDSAGHTRFRYEPIREGDLKN